MPPIPRLTPPEPQPSKALVDKGVQPLQDLLTTSLGRAVALTDVRLKDCEADPHRAKVVDVLFYHDQHSVEPPSATKSPDHHVWNYDTPTLLSGHGLAGNPLPIALPDLLRRWFDVWDAQRDVLQLLLGPLVADFMTLEHRYSSTFQSAESLHGRLGLGSKDLSKQEHKKRQERVLKALEVAGLGAEDARWAGSVLATRNDKSLTAKIEELLETAGALGAALREAVVDEAGVPCFARDASQLRGGVAHPSTHDSQLQRRRAVFAHALRWLVRGHIIAALLDDGDRSAFWKAAAERAYFKWIVEALRDERSQASA